MSATLDTPRRLTASAIIDRLIAGLAKSHTDHSSTDLVRNARGVVQIAVTVRTGDTDEIQTARDASREAQAIFDELCAKYPAPIQTEPSTT